MPWEKIYCSKMTVAFAFSRQNVAGLHARVVSLLENLSRLFLDADGACYRYFVCSIWFKMLKQGFSNRLVEVRAHKIVCIRLLVTVRVSKTSGKSLVLVS